MSAKKNSEVLLHFTTCAFFELLEKERQWFALLDTLRHLRWQRADPDECPEWQASSSCCETADTGCAIESFSQRWIDNPMKKPPIEAEFAPTIEEKALLMAVGAGTHREGERREDTRSFISGLALEHLRLWLEGDQRQDHILHAARCHGGGYPAPRNAES
jgi:hypothetical protein